jgi:twinkle protein
MLTNTDIQAFEERGLDPETADKLGARFSRGRFTFDYRRDGELQFQKMRDQDKKFWIDPKGARLQFWGLDEVPVLPHRPSEPLIITEGEFDRVAVIQTVGGYCLSVPNGAAGQRSQSEIVIAEDTRFSYLWQDEKLIPEVEQFDKVILFTDADDPGQILRDELALRIGPTRCWFVTCPIDCKDANDVLVKFGAEHLRKMIELAKPMQPGHLVKPFDLPPRPLSITRSTGWEFLDKHIMLDRPEMIVVTGEPGHGKGQFIRCMAFNLARAHGWKTAFLAQEDPAHRVRRDMMRFALNLTPYANQDQQRAARAWIDDHFRISTPPEDEPVTLAMVEQEMESAALHHDCQVFVLDPWNEVEHEFKRGESETQYIERAIRQLLRKMRRLNLVLVIAAHPTKLGDGDEASLYKISGSANWKNKCQHGLVVVKPSDHSNGVKLKVEKSKDWETMGKPGSVWLEFNRDQCDYKFVGNAE